MTPERASKKSPSPKEIFEHGWYDDGDDGGSGLFSFTDEEQAIIKAALEKKSTSPREEVVLQKVKEKVEKLPIRRAGPGEFVGKKRVLELLDAEIAATLDRITEKKSVD